MFGFTQGSVSDQLSHAITPPSGISYQSSGLFGSGGTLPPDVEQVRTALILQALAANLSQLQAAAARQATTAQQQMNDAGFEIRHQENLREHYARTLTGWCRNLDEHWDAAVAEVGEGTARVWRVYMAGCVLGFNQNWIQLHQTLGVKLDEDGNSHMPLRPDWGA